MLGFFFSCVLSSADFFQHWLLKKISVSNSLDPDQARNYVGPDLGPNCLQRLQPDDNDKLRVNRKHQNEEPVLSILVRCYAR